MAKSSTEIRSGCRELDLHQHEVYSIVRDSHNLSSHCFCGSAPGAAKGDTVPWSERSTPTTTESLTTLRLFWQCQGQNFREVHTNHYGVSDNTSGKRKASPIDRSTQTGRCDNDLLFGLSPVRIEYSTLPCVQNTACPLSACFCVSEFVNLSLFECAQRSPARDYVLRISCVYLSLRTLPSLVRTTEKYEHAFSPACNTSQCPTARACSGRDFVPRSSCACLFLYTI